MDTSDGQGLYPQHCCKTLHLVRHAQGFHNVAGAKNPENYLSYDYFDASLTALGWEQVDNLRKLVEATGLSKQIELVITSPFTRTMQTAVGAFGGGSYTDETDVTPLMVADAGNSGRPAISSLNCPPFLAVELCREMLGVHPSTSNKRRSKREYKSLFPAIDFSLIENEDNLWEEDVRETNEEVAARGMDFMKWLWTRKEREIAIVSHCGLFFHTLGAFGNDCHQLVKSNIRTAFAKCELRSLVFVNKGISFDSPTTNFPRKFPSGADLPSDVADVKHAKNAT